MANKIKEGKFAATSSRQKVVAVAVVVVLIILVWQIMAIFKSNTPTTPSPKPAPITPSTNTMSANAPGASVSTAAIPNNEVAELAPGKIVNDPAFVKMQKATEEKYVVKLNELEELRLQRQIAEMNQGIAAAKLATVTAEKDISDLLTRPSQPSQPIPESVYTSQLVNQGAAETPIPPPPITNPIADYTLISVSMQLHKWSAVIGYQGKLFYVNIGDSLPDNSTVVSINKNNVILKKDGETKKIAMVSSI